jgi:hypothetical protein
MANHKTPTQEELKAQEEAAVKAAEELKDKPEEETDTSETPNSPPIEVSEKEIPEEEPEKESEEESKEEEPQADPSKELYKKKFSESSKENQKIYAKNRVINKALMDADETPEPTEEELAKEFKDWDIMSEVEKTLAKETVVSRNWRKTIANAKEQATKIEKWNESVDAFVGDPITLNDNPDLEGKTEEFKAFAQQESNNSVPFKILVSAFLHDYSTTKKVNKGKMFEKGMGGSNDKPQPKSDKLTLEESRKLRLTNFTKWKEYLMAGKIENDF